LVPPIAVPLPSGHSYFLLDDFNHHHQHSVLAGESLRYSSTHRVCRTDGHTFASVRARCIACLQNRAPCSAKGIRADQTALSEIEFEWIRQFYVQGEEHYRIHEWWRAPIEELVRFWVQLEERTKRAIETLEDAARINHPVSLLRYTSNTNQYTEGIHLVKASKAKVLLEKTDPEYSRIKRERKRLARRVARAASVEIACYDILADSLRDVINAFRIYILA